PSVAPTISGVTTSNVTGTSATVSWQTDQPSSSQVAFGLTSAYGSTTTLDPAPVTSHSQTITGLSPTTTYHFSAPSGTRVGPPSAPDGSFTTGTSPPPPPVDQTITFGALANRTLNQSPFTVSATASSGLAVTFTASPSAVCTAGGSNGSSIAL